MELAIIDEAKQVEDLCSGCCTLDIWAVFISDEE